MKEAKAQERERRKETRHAQMLAALQRSPKANPESLKDKVKVKSLSHVGLLATSWSVARQAPLSVDFSRQDYWSGLPFPSPGDLPNPGIKLWSPALQADSLPTELQGKPLVPSM